MDAYLGSAECNATEAARQAGYAHPSVKGAQLVKVKKIAEIIKRRMAQEEEEAGLTRERKRELLRKIAEDPVEKRRWAVLKAIDIDNKMAGLYIQRHEIQAQLQAGPTETEEAVVELYRKNPELWERIKKSVEGKK